MKALIIGGGIGGLSAALALNRAGIRCQVFEQAQELREIGAGLTVWIGAIRGLRQLGVADRWWSLGSKVDRLEVRTSRGRKLATTPLAGLERRFGMPAGYVVHRAELLRELATVLEPGQVRCAARCVSIDQEGNRVLARFADGSEASADLLVGADGLHSVVRSHLHGASKPRYAGYTCWRGIAHLDVRDPPPGTSFETWGPGARFAAHHCGPGRLIWYATCNAPEAGADSPAGRKADVQETCRAWHPPIPEIIEATRGEEILRNDIVDRVPAKTWGRGRVTLLGDAAHPTTPNLGMGACLAIEDAVCLAASLAGGPDVAASLRGYERRRLPRATAIIHDSWWIGRVGQWENPMACWLRDLATRWTPGWVSSRMLGGWLNHDQPQFPPATRS